ncbi:MAG: hypothetical protein ACI83P_001191 [Janthinobacterium sp.]|jgi:hypothetical protein
MVTKKAFSSYGIFASPPAVSILNMSDMGLADIAQYQDSLSKVPAINLSVMGCEHSMTCQNQSIKMVYCLLCGAVLAGIMLALTAKK